MKGFSIIVCCYNSANILEETLKHLAALEVPDGYEVEVVLVNNLSTDNTPELASCTWKKLYSSIAFSIVDEPQPGLSFARKKGIQSARYDLLLFCDDDNRLAPDYLLVASRVFENHKNIGVLGGLGLPDYESMPDYWSEDFFIYGSGPQAGESGKVPYVHGAGIIIRRSAFQLVENAKFDFLLTDRKGNELTSGGDYELCYIIALAGYDVWYEKRLTFNHYITSDRLTRQYCYKFIRESAPSIDVLDVYRYFMQHDGALGLDFYWRQVKLTFYHAYKLYVSYTTKLKFRGDMQIGFLEDFHMRFHTARVKCIGKSFFRYGKWAKQVSGLKKRLSHAL